jgi:Predicted transcriptional regulators
VTKLKTKLKSLAGAFGENVRTLRDGKGWSRSELSKKSGVTEMTITQVELGKTKNPGIDTASKLAKALGCVTSELLGEVRTPLTPRETQLVMCYRKLNVKMRRCYLFVGMSLVGELSEDEEDMRHSADWSSPTEGRDPIVEMLERAEARGDQRPDLDKLEESSVELGHQPKPDGTRNPWPGKEAAMKLVDEKFASMSNREQIERLKEKEANARTS